MDKQGIRIDHSTLNRWRTRHAEKYESLQADLLPKLRAEAAEPHSAVADAEMEVGFELLDRLRKSQGDLDPRDLSTAIRNLDVGQGIHRTKAAELRGEDPPAINVNLDLQAAIQSLIAKGARVVESDAEELPPDVAGQPEAPPT